jgi:hypothetical protein
MLMYIHIYVYIYIYIFFKNVKNVISHFAHYNLALVRDMALRIIPALCSLDKCDIRVTLV